jgi:two-component system response regulator MprA
MQPRVLLVEDDSELRRLVRLGLEEAGFDVAAAATGHEAMLRAAGDPPAALIIDVGLPDADGRDVCQALRAQGVHTPVLFLTARNSVADRLSGFGAGGDDYVTKPFVLAEVVARLRALLRRSAGDQQVSVGGMRVDPVSHEVTIGELTLSLSPTEFRLLGALAAGEGGAVRRIELVRAAWPEGAVVHDNTLDVYVARLRRKLRDVPDSPKIATVYGVGYRLE